MSPLSIQLPVNAPGKAEEDGPRLWASVAHIERPDSSWLKPDPELAVVAFWDTNQYIGKPLSASPSLALSDSN